jgi:hypothetical protein
MVTAVVDEHIGALRHVAVGAEAAGRSNFVEGVLRPIEDVSLVTADTQGIPLGTKGRAVRLVAVATNDSSHVHLALQERPVDVHLVLDLPVFEVEKLVECRETIAIVVAAMIATEIGTTRVTRGTGF